MNYFHILSECTQNNYACRSVVGTEGIPGDIVNIIHYVYLAIKVIVPVVLIIFGMIELGKAIASQKDDEIKKVQSSFIKKLIIAVVIFLTLSIVEFAFDFANSGDSTSSNIWGCINDVLQGNCR